jgi:hypothetical protein
MLPQDGFESALRSYFRQLQIAEIADLFHLLGTRLRISVFRRLKAVVSTNVVSASRPLYAGWKPGLTVPGWLRGKLRSGLAASPAPDNYRVEAAEESCRGKRLPKLRVSCCVRPLTPHGGSSALKPTIKVGFLRKVAQATNKRKRTEGARRAHRIAEAQLAAARPSPRSVEKTLSIQLIAG